MLKGASATLLLTLAARAAASRVVPELAFQDDRAEHIARHAPYELDRYAQDPGFVRGVVLRSAMMDAMVGDFFTRHPHGLAVSLGAGLCTRRHRLIAQGLIDAHQPWLHVDLPEVMALRRSLIEEETGERGLACSLLDEAEWLHAVDAGQPAVFILEGVCPYLPDDALRAWFTRLAEHRRTGGTPWDMVLDTVDPELLRMPTQVGDMNLPLRSAFHDIGELTALHPDMRALSVHHPFSRFSAGHAQFEADMRARTGRPLYAIAHLTLDDRTRDGPH